MQTQGGHHMAISRAMSNATAQSPMTVLASEILKVRHGRVLGERKRRHVRRPHLRINRGHK